MSRKPLIDVFAAAAPTTATNASNATTFNRPASANLNAFLTRLSVQVQRGAQPVAEQANSRSGSHTSVTGQRKAPGDSKTAARAPLPVAASSDISTPTLSDEVAAAARDSDNDSLYNVIHDVEELIERTLSPPAVASRQVLAQTSVFSKDVRADTPASSDIAESIASETPFSSIDTAESINTTVASVPKIAVDLDEYDSDFEDMSTGGGQELDSRSSGHIPRTTVAQVRANVMCDVHTQTTATTSVDDVHRTQLEHVLTKSLALDYYDHAHRLGAPMHHLRSTLLTQHIHLFMQLIDVQRRTYENWAALNKRLIASADADKHDARAAT